MSGNDDFGWWERRTLWQKVLIGIGIGVGGLAFLALFGWVTMSLWNWLMPDIFGLKTIDYWQAWGLLALSMIFFKSWGSGEGGRDRKRKKHLRQYMKDENGDWSCEPKAKSEAKKDTPEGN